MNHASGRPVVAIAIVLSAFVVCERRASACDCVGLPTSEYLRGADVVYTGRVVSIRAEGQRFAWPEIEFRLDRTIKGRTDGKRFVLVTPPTNGVNCRGFDFVVGKEYLVFATGRDSETGLPGTYGVNWCAGTKSLDADDGKQRLREALQLPR
jgi:hypothetical protein